MTKPTESGAPIEFEQDGETLGLSVCRVVAGTYRRATPSDLVAALQTNPELRMRLAHRLGYLLIDEAYAQQHAAEAEWSRLESAAIERAEAAESKLERIRQEMCCPEGGDLFEHVVGLTEKVVAGRLSRTRLETELAKCRAELERGKVELAERDEDNRCLLRVMGEAAELAHDLDQANEGTAEAIEELLKVHLRARAPAPATGDQDSSPSGQKAETEHDRFSHDRSAATESPACEPRHDGLVRSEVATAGDDRRAEGGAQEPRAGTSHHEAGGSSPLGRRSDDGRVATGDQEAADWESCSDAMASEAEATASEPAPPEAPKLPGGLGPDLLAEARGHLVRALGQARVHANRFGEASPFRALRELHMAVECIADELERGRQR